MFAYLLFGTIAMNVFALLLIYLRPRIFKNKLFKPMVWNFKLSIIPLLVLSLTFFLALAVSYVFALTQWNFLYYIPYFIAAIGLTIWLLLLPNAGYLITELNMTHRSEDHNPVPMWYDIVAVLSFALSGIMNTLLNIVLIQLMYIIIVDPAEVIGVYSAALWLSAVLLIVLLSFGIYLGRSIRFNSWDVVHPLRFFKKILDHFKQKGNLTEMFLFVTLHSFLFFILYCAFAIPAYFSG